MNLRLTVTMLALSVAGCAVGPDYRRPSAPVPAAYKEASTAAGATWLPAAPADALARGEWWRLFGDDELNRLAERIEVDNQNVLPRSPLTGAQAIVGECARARFPTLGLSASARRTGGRDQADVSAFALSLAGYWAPDLWGRLGRGVGGARGPAKRRAPPTSPRPGCGRQGELATTTSRSAKPMPKQPCSARRSKATALASDHPEPVCCGHATKTDLLQAQTQLSSTRASCRAGWCRSGALRACE